MVCLEHPDDMPVLEPMLINQKHNYQQTHKLRHRRISHKCPPQADSNTHPQTDTQRDTPPNTQILPTNAQTDTPDITLPSPTNTSTGKVTNRTNNQEDTHTDQHLYTPMDSASITLGLPNKRDTIDDTGPQLRTDTPTNMKHTDTHNPLEINTHQTSTQNPPTDLPLQPSDSHCKDREPQPITRKKKHSQSLTQEFELQLMRPVSSSEKKGIQTPPDPFSGNTVVTDTPQHMSPHTLTGETLEKAIKVCNSSQFPQNSTTYR